MKTDFFQNIDISSPWIIALLVATGFVVGVINTLAGSGTAISYAVFMWLGLSPSTANGTVRLGVITQTFAASVSFYRNKYLKIRESLFIAIPITLGSVIGAQIAVSINQEIFKIIIGFAMVLMLFFIFYKPDNWIRENENIQVKNKFWHLILYCVIGVYGGFIHMGVGIFLLSALVLVSGYNLVYANSLKVFVVFIYTPFTLFVFIYNHEIHYMVGIICAIGNTLGGIFASSFAMKFGAKYLKWILMTVIIIFSAYLFGVFDFLYTFVK